MHYKFPCLECRQLTCAKFSGSILKLVPDGEQLCDDKQGSSAADNRSRLSVSTASSGRYYMANKLF